MFHFDDKLETPILAFLISEPATKFEGSEIVYCFNAGCR